MIRVILSNNAGVQETIVEDSAILTNVMADAGFTYGTASITVDGIPYRPEELGRPVSDFAVAGNQIRVTAVEKTANA